MYPWRINFWMQKHSETSKGHPQYIFVAGKNFLHLSVLSFSLFCWTKFFHSKFSSGHVKCSFEKCAENILPENPCLFAQWTKRSRNFFSIEIPTSSSCSSGRKKWKFDKPSGKISTKCRKNFDQSPKLQTKTISRRAFFDSSFGHVECNFETFDETISTKSEKFTLNI